MPRLVVLRGPDQGRAFQVTALTTIGRSSTNSIQLSGEKVSRRHATIAAEGNSFIITDHGSRNGVLVNGRHVDHTVLASGDHIAIGTSLLLFALDDSDDFPTQEMELKKEGGQQQTAQAKSTEEGGQQWPAPTRIPEEGGHADTPPQREKLPSGEPVFFSEEAAASARHFEESMIIGDDAAVPTQELLQRLRDSNRKLKVLHDVSDAIQDVSDTAELLHKILDLVLDIFEAERAVILLYDQADGELRPASSRNRTRTTARLAVSKTVVDYVARRMRSVISADALADPRFDPSDSIALQEINSVLCVPLTSKGKSQGVLYVDNRHGMKRFQQDDLRLLTIIARQAASAIDNARSYTDLRKEREELKRQVTEKYTIVGESASLRAVLEMVRQVAHGDTTVLILGETGSGKELIARAIHEESYRSGGPFVIVNCASMPEALLESELFGHEKGAFTGAVAAKTGRFELAHHGTLFLDEVGELGLAIQTKLLRAVENKVFDRVGGTKPVSVDVRILAATNRDLARMVQEGTFRQDLYYRLAVVPISVPPLRERQDDIPRLAVHFLEGLGRDIGRRLPRLSDQALKLMIAYHWPGNVRELKNAMERAILLNRTGVIEPDDLPPSITGAAIGPTADGVPVLPMDAAVRAAERRAIREAMRLADGVKSKAAEILGISRPTLDKKLKEYEENDE